MSFTIMARRFLAVGGVLGSTPDIGAAVLVALLKLELLATATGVSHVELGAHWTTNRESMTVDETVRRSRAYF